MSETEKLTPMMQQYFEVKRGLPRDTLLLFRLGDFFEMFFDDAAVASRLLGLTLTKRQADKPGTGILYVAGVTGPLQVFASANEWARRFGKPAPYAPRVVASTRSSCISGLNA